METAIASLRETIRISPADVSTARGRNNIYPPGRWKLPGLSNPLHFLFRTALHSLLQKLRGITYLYLHLSLANDPSRGGRCGATVAHYFFPVTLKSSFVISPRRVRVRAGTCGIPRATSIRGKGKRTATTS